MQRCQNCWSARKHRGKLLQKVLSPERFATSAVWDAGRTVSHICSLICLPSMFIMRAPNSTPIVRSCTGWKRLSVNCNSRHDLPTPAQRHKVSTCEHGKGLAKEPAFLSHEHAPVSPIMMY